MIHFVYIAVVNIQTIVPVWEAIMSSGFIIYFRTASQRIGCAVFYLAYLEGSQMESNIPVFLNYSREMPM